MKFLRLTTFYCCCKLRTGTLITGYCGILFGIAFFIFNLFLRYDYRRLLDGHSSSYFVYGEITEHFEEYTKYMLMQKMSTAFMTVRSFFLILGVYRKNLRFIEVWLYGIIFYVLMFFASLLYIGVVLNDEKYLLTVLLEITMYFLLVIGEKFSKMAEPPIITVFFRFYTLSLAGCVLILRFNSKT